MAGSAWSNQAVVAALVDIIAGSPGSGLFVYSGPPAHGNLIASITAAAGTDPFTNPFKAGITSYDNTFGNTAEITGSFIQLFTASALAMQISSAGLSVLNSHGALIYSVDAARTAQFLYADTGSATQGALLASEAQASGTDSFSNAYLAGNSVYSATGGTFFAVELLTRGLSFQTASSAAGPYTSQAAINLDTSNQLQLLCNTNLFLNPNSGAGIVYVTGNVAKFIAGTGAEIWHVVGAASQPVFVNSFSAGGTAPRFQLEPIGGGRVRLSGAVNTGAVTAANTTIFTLPAGYVPARQLSFVTANNVTAYTLGSASVQVTTGGAVQLVPAGTAGKFVLLDGICFELD